MILPIAIIVISTFIALNGLLYQPKKDPDGPTNWEDHDAYQKAFDRLLRDLKAESAEASE